MVRSAFRTKIETVLLLAAAIFPSPVAAASQAEYPVAIPAQAPHFPERASILRLPDDADRKQLIDTHRMLRPEHRRVFLTLRTPRWWLVIPPAQRTGGYRLRVRLDAETASACLDPPRGLVTLAFSTPSYFVALPRQVKRIDWQDICAPPSAPSGEGSGCEGRIGSGAPGH